MSKFYEVLSILVVVVIFSLSFYYLQVFRPATQNIGEIKATTTPTAIYSMNGKVAIVKDDTLTLSVTSAFVDNEGTHLVNNKKIVKITDKTKIFSTRLVLGKLESKEAKTSDVKVGSEVRVYSTEDVARLSAVEATRLDVLLK